MTTLCLCDWVAPKSGREHLRAGIDADATLPESTPAPRPIPGAVPTGAEARDDATETCLNKEYAR